MVSRFFADEEELVEALADRLVWQARQGDRILDAAPPDAVVAGWADRLRAVAHGIRRALLAHLAVVPAALRDRRDRGATLDGIDAGLELLPSAGLTPESAATCDQAVLLHTLGLGDRRRALTTGPPPVTPTSARPARRCGPSW